MPTVLCSMHTGVYKTGDGVEEATLNDAGDSLAGNKGLNAAVQGRHQHMRVSCNSSLDSDSSVSLRYQLQTVITRMSLIQLI